MHCRLQSHRVLWPELLDSYTCTLTICTRAANPVPSGHTRCTEQSHISCTVHTQQVWCFSNLFHLQQVHRVITMHGHETLILLLPSTAPNLESIMHLPDPPIQWNWAPLQPSFSSESVEKSRISRYSVQTGLLHIWKSCTNKKRDLYTQG